MDGFKLSTPSVQNPSSSKQRKNKMKMFLFCVSLEKLYTV